MNKRLMKFLGLLLGIGILVCGLCVWYARTSDSSDITEKDYLEAARRLGRVPREAARVDTPKVTNPSRPIRLAIGGLGLPEDARNRQLGDLIVASLTSAGGVELVERQSLDKVLRESELSLSSFVRAKDAVRVGGLLRADWFLLGGFLSLGGTNSLVVRIVDSQSGVMRDIGVFPLVADDARVAEEIASFVRQHLQATSTAKPRTYLAVGAMEDLSFSDRQAALPTTLRSYLAAAYRESKITTLEREYADTLLQEMYLELAALTQSSRADEVRRIQPAFWLVDGYYQSYETASNEVQCVLQVTRIFGKSQTLQLRGRSVEELFQEIKTAIDASLAASGTRTIVPTKRSEISAQMVKGRETSPRVLEGLPTIAYPGNPDGSGARIRRRNLEEAIRAFQTVLLLDPENHEAEMRLAACEFDPLIHRVEDARNHCQHLVGTPTQDDWTGLARPAMAWSYLFDNTSEAARWFEAAAATCSDTNKVVVYRVEAAKLGAQAKQAAATDPGQKLKAAEALLLANVDDCAGLLRRKGWSDYAYPFITFMRTCRAEGVPGDDRLLALLPALKERNPDFVPYLVAAVMINLQQTNGVLVQEFEQSLEGCANHPDKVLGRTFTLSKCPPRSTRGVSARSALNSPPTPSGASRAG